MSFRVFPLSVQSGINCTKGPSRHIRRVSLLALSAAAIQAFTPTTALADVIPLNLATEVMIEDTASNNLIVGALFDPTNNSKLSYNTVMGADGSYTYSTVAGSMLDGKSISLTGSGTASSTGPPTWQWVTSESGDYNGSPYWSVTDLETVTVDPDGYYIIVSDYNYYDKDGNKTGDLHIIVVTDPDVTVDADAGYFTDKNGAKVPKSDFVSASALDEETGDWDIEVLPVYPPYEPIPPQIVSIGTSPLGGGDGSFTTTFVVPEPSTWAMMLVGFVGLAFAGSRSRKRTAAPAL
jgi:hypothetical protein